MPATMVMLQLRLLSWAALGPGASSFIGRSQLTLANKTQAKGGDDDPSRTLSSERSCDFCDGANRTRSWHWPQCERCRSGSARIACCLRGKAAISQSARECPGSPGNCPGSEMGNTARTVAEQAVDWFAPLRPPKDGPPNPSRASALPHDGWSVHCFNSVPVAVARSRAASDPVPEIHHANLHPSSIVRGRHIPGGSQHQQKEDHGEGEPRTGSASSVDALFPRSLSGGGSPDDTTI